MTAPPWFVLEFLIRSSSEEGQRLALTQRSTVKIPKLLKLTSGAALITCSSATVTIDYVTVGAPGNAPSIQWDGGIGAVSYVYQIGKYEVTNAQYGEFLNAVAAADPYRLYRTSMSTSGITRNGTAGSYTYSVTAALANHPVVHVSWFDAARFANWLANGQGSGDTENGSYTLNGAFSGVPVPANPGAQVYIPSINEWYKAAFHQGNGTYAEFANGRDAITIADANYDNSIGSRTDVGSYPAGNFGIHDMAGNVSELTSRGDYNLAAYQSDPSFIPAWGGNFTSPREGASQKNIMGADERNTIGFRLASVATVPEPSSVLLAALSGCVLLILRRR